jgi:hypothetical protein
MTVSPDDTILISVDAHVCEPADYGDLRALSARGRQAAQCAG